MMKKYFLICAILICGITQQTGATILTSGTLTYDDAGNQPLIYDTAIHRTYYFLPTLPYSDIGIILEDANLNGFNINLANRAVAEEFLRAAVVDINYQTTFSNEFHIEGFGNAENYFFGDNFVFGYGPSVQSPWYGLGTVTPLSSECYYCGAILFSASYTQALEEQYIDEFYATTQTAYWMLYQDQVSPVPEPSTLAIFALGIMGLASRRFKK